MEEKLKQLGKQELALDKTKNTYNYGLYEFNPCSTYIDIQISLTNIKTYEELNIALEDLKTQIIKDIGYRKFVKLNLFKEEIDIFFRKKKLMSLLMYWRFKYHLYGRLFVRAELSYNTIRIRTDFGKRRIMDFTYCVKFLFKASRLLRETYNGNMALEKRYSYGGLYTCTGSTSRHIRSVLLERRNIRNFLNKYKIR